MAQAEGQLIETSAGLCIGLRLHRIRMHDQVQATLEVVEDRHFLAEHEQGIRRAELIRLVDAGKARLDPADGLEAEITDQAAGKRRHVGQYRYTELPAQCIDFRQRIGQLARLDDFAKFLDAEGMSAQRIHAPARQADDRMASPVLATLHRFKQIRIRPVSQFQVHRQGRIQIRQNLARHRNAVVTLGGETIELLLGDHGTAIGG